MNVAPTTSRACRARVPWLTLITSPLLTALINFIDCLSLAHAGHGPTNYKQWFNATAPYKISYAVGYEPYLLISRRLMPLYDERFRGYGFDKVSFTDPVVNIPFSQTASNLQLPSMPASRSCYPCGNLEKTLIENVLLVFVQVMHIWQLDAQGFQFMGHPAAWVVHRPHTPSAGYQKAFTGPAYTQNHRVRAPYFLGL